MCTVRRAQTYGTERLKGKVVGDIADVHHQGCIRLKREPWRQTGDGCVVAEGDMCEEEQRGPENDRNADHVDRNIDRVGVVACVECELRQSQPMGRDDGINQDMPVS